MANLLSWAFNSLTKFGTLDSRKQTAMWVARWFTELPRNQPGVTGEEIVHIALQARYQNSAGPRPDLYAKAMAVVNEGAIRDARDLSHLIAELELLNHLTPLQRETLEMNGESIVVATYRAMDEQLAKSGL